jgi:transposase
MPQPNDLSRSLVALDENSTIIAVIEMSQSSWLVAGGLPGIERQPRKKLEPNAEGLLGLLHRWRDEAVRAGKEITRIAVAFEAGRDGFWLARWLEARGVEARVIHPSSVAVSREHRRAKTDRLDTELLKRGFLGWLRGERGHCSMARVPTIAEEDAKRPNRERECLVGERTRIVNRIKATLARMGIRNFKPTLRGPAPAKAGGGRTSCNGAHPGRHAAAAKCLGRAAARHGRGWGLLSARSERSRKLVRNDWSSSLRPGSTPWFGCWRESSVLVSRRLICWSMRCCLGPCVTAEQWPAEPVLGPAKGRTRGPA